MDEPPVEVGEPEECLYLSDLPWFRPILDCGYLCWVHCSPLGDRMNLRYSMVSMWNLHFFRFAYSPALHRHHSTSQTWFQWSSRESEYTRMSSRYPTIHTSIRSPSTSLMNLWKDASVLESPNGITCHSYEP